MKNIKNTAGKIVRSLKTPRSCLRQKRKYAETETSLWEPMLNKTKYTDIVSISPSQIRNHVHEDPLAEWIEMYYTKIGYNEFPNEKNKNDLEKLERQHRNTYEGKGFSFSNKTHSSEKFGPGNKYLKGNIFEQIVYDKIIEIIGKENFKDMKKEGKQHHLDTYEEMMNGTPVIAQGMLYNPINNTFGISDLIVSSKFVNKILRTNILTPEEENISAPYLRDKGFHYVVLDIKYQGFELYAGTMQLRAAQHSKFVKCQLAIYNLAVGLLQGYISPKAYVVGKYFKDDSKSSPRIFSYALDALGTVDYSDKRDNEIINITADYIERKRIMTVEGHMWQPLKHDIKNPDLFPNMKVKNDSYLVENVKNRIAEVKDEITRVAYLNVTSREKALEKGISVLSECTPDTFELPRNTPRTKYISKIMEINRQDKIIFMPEKLDPTVEDDLLNMTYKDWLDTDNYNDFYFDFETYDKNNGREVSLYAPEENGTVLFMIGVGYYNPNGKWISKNFTLEQKEDEQKNFIDFIEYVKRTSDFLNKRLKKKNKTRLIHWSQYEENIIKKLEVKSSRICSLLEKSGVIYLDLYDVFTKIPIVIKGAYRHSLKHFSKRMYELKMIENTWTGSIGDGYDASLKAVDYYIKAERNELTEREKELMENIEKYNLEDILILSEVTQYFREKYGKK